MHFLDVTLADLAENLALDEALLLHAEAGGPEVLRLWEWPTRAVVVGAGGCLGAEVNEAACQADDVPIFRRSSGGGTVLLGAGCLLFSLILRFDRHPALNDLHASYRFILQTIERSLTAALSGAAPTFEGTSDLALAGRKISGNAQHRKRTHLLHHGSLLYQFDAAPLARYLQAPPRQPEYRRGRSHADFVTNVPLTATALRQLIKEAWSADEPFLDWPMDLASKLAAEKYASAEWIRRR